MGILNFGPIAATRRNHAIEHATIHILSRMRPDTSMAGRSNTSGFVIYGDLSTDSVRQAVQEAIQRLKGGEHHLAIHPNCGTNMVTTAVMTVATTLVAGIGGSKRHWLERIPTMVTAALVAVFVSHIVGTTLQQRLTTSAELGLVAVLDVQRRQFGQRVLHWVSLQHAPLAGRS